MVRERRLEDMLPSQSWFFEVWNKRLSRLQEVYRDKHAVTQAKSPDDIRPCGPGLVGP